MDILLITYPLNGLLMVAMPVALAIYLTRRFKLGWRLWFIGAGAFIVSQIGHILFNYGASILFNRAPLTEWPEAWQLVFSAIFLGLSAGFWEELVRYGMFRWAAKDARSWSRGLLVGAGHGGAEAIIFGALVLLTFFQLAALRNADLATIVSPEQLELAQAQVAAYWSAPWYYSLLGAVERAFAIPIQIALAVLVLQVFTRKHIRWLWVAIGAHAFVDCAAVLVLSTLGVFATEAIAGLFALLSLGVIFALRQPEPLEIGEPSQIAPAPFIPKEVEATKDKLDDTKYL